MGILAWAARTMGSAARAYHEARMGPDSQIRQFSALQRLQGSPVPPSMTGDVSRYASSDDVYAAVGTLADSASTVPWRVTVGGEEAEDHDLALLLQRCNPWQGGVRFWQAAYSWLWLTGECYVVIERANPMARGEPSALWLLDPRTIKPLPDPTQMVGAYRWTPNPHNAAEFEDIEARDVIPLALWNPNDPLRGLSPLASLRIGLDSERLAKAANRDILENGLMVDGVMSMPGLNETQRRQLDEAVEKRHKGEGNRHKMLMVAAEVQVHPLTLTPRDLEFVELDKLTTRDVAKAYRIPPMFLGDMSDATYSNYETAHRAYWEQGILPKIRLVAAALTVGLAEQYGPDTEVSYDTTGVEALRENDKTLADTAKVLVDAGYDRLWAIQSQYGDQVGEEAVGEYLPTTLQNPNAGPAIPKAAPAATRAALAAPETRAAVRRERYARLRAAQAALAPTVRTDIDRGFAGQWRDLSAAIDSIDHTKSLEPGGAVADQMTDVLWQTATAGSSMEIATRTVLNTVAAGGAEATANLFGFAVQSGAVDQAVRQYVDKAAAAHVQWVDQATRDDMRREIGIALDNREGLKGVRQRLQGVFRGSGDPEQEMAYADRVENIAQTELCRAFNHGALESYKLALVDTHTWEWSGIEPSRHADVSGQSVAVGSPFDVHGHPALYPGDDNLPIGEAAQCKCITLPDLEE